MHRLALITALLAGCAAGFPDEGDTGPTGPTGEVMQPPGQQPPPQQPPPQEPPPEMIPPPPDRCAGIDAQGLCRGQIAVWCEDGVLRNVDCRSVGQPCEWNPIEDRFFCFDGQLPPDSGVPPPQGPPPDAGIPPPQDPPPDDPPDEPLPPPMDVCMGVTEKGECRGTVSVVCVDGEELVFFDCAILGLQCVDLFFVFGCGEA